MSDEPEPCLHRHCRKCGDVRCIDDVRIKPAWLITEHGIRLGRFVETRPPAPCSVCGGRVFQYRADWAYFQVLYARLPSRRLPGGLLPGDEPDGFPPGYSVTSTAPWEIAPGVPWTQAANATPLADVQAITAMFHSEPGPFYVMTNRALLEAGLARWPNSEVIRAALAYLDTHPELEDTSC